MQSGSLPPAACIASHVNEDAQIVKQRRGRLSRDWKFVIRCAQVDGHSSLSYATEPIWTNGICSYQYLPSPQSEVPRPERIVPTGTIFDRAAVSDSTTCPSVNSATYVNLWKVSLRTFRNILTLQYSNEILPQWGNARIVRIDSISLSRKTLLFDQYQLVINANNGVNYLVSVRRYLFGDYHVASIGKEER